MKDKWITCLLEIACFGSLLIINLVALYSDFNKQYENQVFISHGSKPITNVEVDNILEYSLNEQKFIITDNSVVVSRKDKQFYLDCINDFVVYNTGIVWNNGNEVCLLSYKDQDVVTLLSIPKERYYKKVFMMGEGAKWLMFFLLFAGIIIFAHVIKSFQRKIPVFFCIYYFLIVFYAGYMAIQLLPNSVPFGSVFCSLFYFLLSLMVLCIVFMKISVNIFFAILCILVFFLCIPVVVQVIVRIDDFLSGELNFTFEKMFTLLVFILNFVYLVKHRVEIKKRIVNKE